MGLREPESNLQGNKNERKRTPSIHLGGGKNCEVVLRMGAGARGVHLESTVPWGQAPMAPLSPTSGSAEGRCLGKKFPGTYLPSPRQELLLKL